MSTHESTFCSDHGVTYRVITRTDIAAARIFWSSGDGTAEQLLLTMTNMDSDEPLALWHTSLGTTGTGRALKRRLVDAAVDHYRKATVLRDGNMR